MHRNTYSKKHGWNVHMVGGEQEDTEQPMLFLED